MLWFRKGKRDAGRRNRSTTLSHLALLFGWLADLTPVKVKSQVRFKSSGTKTWFEFDPRMGVHRLRNMRTKDSIQNEEYNEKERGTQRRAGAHESFVSARVRAGPVL